MAAILKKLNGTPIGGLFMKFSLPFSDSAQNLALKKLRSGRSTEISPTLLQHRNVSDTALGGNFLLVAFFPTLGNGGQIPCTGSGILCPPR